MVCFPSIHIKRVLSLTAKALNSLLLCYFILGMLLAILRNPVIDILLTE